MACKLGAVLAGPLTAADRNLLTKWVAEGRDSHNRVVSAETMATAITQGTSTAIGPTTLKDHRGGRCACYRKASA